MINFLNLIRYKNLVIITLLNLLIKYFIINQHVNYYLFSDIMFIIYLIGFISIVAAGYVINDIYDIETDKINKPSSRIVEVKVSVRNAKKIYKLLNSIGVICAIYLSIVTSQIWIFFSHVIFIILLFQYSKTLKTTYLIGNLLIAFLTSCNIICIGLFDLSNKNQFNYDFTINLILIYSLFCFFMTLVREIIKDIEDHKGDVKINANTIIIKDGVKRAKKIIVFNLLVLIISLAYLQNQILFSSNDFNFWLTSYSIIIQLLFLIVTFKILNAKSKSDYTSCSTFTKIVMLVGILSIPLISI